MSYDFARRGLEHFWACITSLRLFAIAAASIILAGVVFAGLSGGAAAQSPYDMGGHNRYDSRDGWRGSPDMDWLWEPRHRQGGRGRFHSRVRSEDEYGPPPHLRRDSAGGHSRARSLYESRRPFKPERPKPNRAKTDRPKQDDARRQDDAKRDDAPPQAPKAERPPVEEPRRKEPASDAAGDAAKPVEPAVEPSQDYRPKKDIPKKDIPKPKTPQAVSPKAEPPVSPKPAPVAPAQPEPTAAEPQEAAPQEPAPQPQAMGPGNYPIFAPEKDAPVPEEARSVPKQVLTLIRSSQDASVEAELAKAHRLDQVSGENVPLLDARMQIYRIKDNRTIEQTVTELVADPRVMAVQPNYIYRHQGAAQAAVPPENLRYYREKLQLAAAHQLAKGKGVLVAVIDSAIDMSHPDLSGAISDAFDAAGGGKDGEYDAHGTAVAGVIRGAAGVAPEARLLPVRAFVVRTPGKEPEATTQALIRGVQWAVDRGAKVLNMSFSGPEDPAFQSILAMARIHKAVAVAAAGNGGPAAAPVFPAAYPEVIAVTALDRNDQVYDAANHGRYVAVAAPGVQILAPSKRKGYAYYTGTSFAAAQVSGVIALMFEKKKDLDPAKVRDALLRSAESLGPDSDGNAASGSGRVNAAAAVRLVEEQQ